MTMKVYGNALEGKPKGMNGSDPRLDILMFAS